MARVIMTYSRAWHALAIGRSLGRQGIEVYCGEEAPFAACILSKHCAGQFQYPSANEEPERFIVFLVEKVRELKPPQASTATRAHEHREFAIGTWIVIAAKYVDVRTAIEHSTDRSYSL